MEKKRESENFRKILLSLGSLMSILLLVIMAPESELGIPKTIWPLIIAVFLMGYAQGLAILPYIPEQNMLLTKYYPKIDYD